MRGGQIHAVEPEKDDRPINIWRPEEYIEAELQDEKGRKK